MPFAGEFLQSNINAFTAGIVDDFDVPSAPASWRAGEQDLEQDAARALAQEGDR